MPPRNSAKSDTVMVFLAGFLCFSRVINLIIAKPTIVAVKYEFAPVAGSVVAPRTSPKTSF